MADVSQRCPYTRSAKRRADAINFLSNISLDGSVTTKPSPRTVSQRQKDDETESTLCKKDEDKQGTSTRTGLAPVPDETSDKKCKGTATGPSTNRLLPAELTGTPQRSGVDLSRSMNSGHGSSKSSIISSVKNPLSLGRTRRLSGPSGHAGEKSPPISPQKFDTSKQRLLPNVVTCSSRCILKFLLSFNMSKHSFKIKS